MTEAKFPSAPEAFEPFAVTVDIVLMTIEAGSLRVLLVKRAKPPYEGRWSLPGGFVGAKEELYAAAQRVLHQKARLHGIRVEQLQAFGGVHRDKRMRIVTVAYFALVPRSRLPMVSGPEDGLRLATTGDLGACDENGRIDVPFDHANIIIVARQRLREKLDHGNLAFRLLPDEFTLFDLQKVHEAVLGRPVNKPAFRKRMLDSGKLQPTGKRAEGTKFRPAELYRYVGERTS